MAQIVKLIIIALLTLVGMEQAEARSAAAVTAVSSLLPCDLSETTCAIVPATASAAVPDAGLSASVPTVSPSASLCNAAAAATAVGLPQRATAPNFEQNANDMSNRITDFFGIQHPIIAGGMAWCSGWRLAAAVTNAGGLGLIGAGSMTPEVLEENIVKCRAAVGGRPYGVNIPLANPMAPKVMELVERYQVPVVFTSAGSPKKWTSWLHDRGVKVAHVVASSTFARKCEEAGVDVVVAEGFEAGGHNGREETTTLCLIPAVRKATSLPLVAAGGIATGDAILAAEALGAEGVQIGTRFAITKESSAHDAFKQLCLNLNEGDTKLLLKKLSPTRLVSNKFRTVLEEAEANNATAEQLLEIIGVGRAKLGMFDGDTDNGELEIGQVAALFKGRAMQSVGEAMAEMLAEYAAARERLFDGQT